VILKHALKTAIAVGILAAMFQNSDLAHIQYPVMGVLATMLSSVGDTVKAGWGRLGGSMVAGGFAVLIIGTYGPGPVTGGVAFILASLCCELLGWKALIGQAGVIVALIAAEPTLGAAPGIYTVDRVFENGIGVFVATAVTYCFWPERPQHLLQQHLSRVLSLVDQGIQTVIQDGQSQTALAELEQQTTQIRQLAQKSESLLSRSLYGFLGRKLVQDNWSDRIATERRLRRHLITIGRVRRRDPVNPLLGVFRPELQALGDQISLVCAGLTQILRLGPSAAAQTTLPLLEADLPAILNRLTEMRRQGKTRAYALPEVIQFYDFLAALTRLTQDLDQLAQKLRDQEKPVAPARPFWQPKLYSIPTVQLRHYLKVGIALGLTLGIVDFAQIPYGYYAALGLVISMQPILGKAIHAGRQRVLGTGVGALVALVVVNSLGSNPLTVGLGTALTILICDRLGLDQAGYKPGCFLMVIAIMIHSGESNSYIWGRFWITLLGVGIGMLVFLIFPPETANQKIAPSFSQTFRNLEQLYQTILDDYRQGLEVSQVSQKIKPLIAAIRQGIQTQDNLQTDSKLELIENFRAAPPQRFWNFIHSYERTLFTDILALKNATTQAESGLFTDLFPQEFAAIQQNIGLALAEIARSTETQPDLLRLMGLAMPLEAIQQQLEQSRNSRPQGSGLIAEYDLSQAIAFFGILSALREIAENLEQMAKDWPQHPG
jgi:uncharacterized membrane protein YgaE (UPF0421/DUF939 family)